MNTKEKKTGAAIVAQGNENGNVAGNVERLTLKQLEAKTAAAFRDFYAVNVERMSENGRRLVDILDAVEDDMCSLMGDCSCWDYFAYTYSNRADLLEVIGNDPEKCFDTGRFAYSFNPFHPDNKEDGFNDSHEYIALDGYAHLCSIRDREYLACWYDGNISDYLGGNYGKPNVDSLQALAEVFGADYDDGEEEGGEA